MKLNQEELMAEWEITDGTMRELVQFSERRKGNVLTLVSLSQRVPQFMPIGVDNEG